MNYRTLEEMIVAAEVRFVRLMEMFEEAMQGDRAEYQQEVEENASEPEQLGAYQ